VEILTLLDLKLITNYSNPNGLAQAQRQTNNPWTRTENLEINPYIPGLTTFNKCAKQFHGGKNSLFNKWRAGGVTPVESTCPATARS
jgi:hypothetical protein